MVSETEIKEWYNRRHLDLGENAWRSADAYPIFLDFLGVSPGKTLLDVGCGTGHLLRAAAQKGMAAYGVELSEEGGRIAKKNCPDSEISIGRGEALNFCHDSFDYVTCLGALEHFLDIEKGLEEFCRVARSDARFCIVVPNRNYFFWKLQRLKGTEQQDINETLLSLKEWQDLFNKKGLEKVNVYQDRGIARNIKILASPNPLRILRRTLARLIWVFMPLKYTYQFVFILRKRRGES